MMSTGERGWREEDERMGRMDRRVRDLDEERMERKRGMKEERQCVPGKEDN